MFNNRNLPFGGPGIPTPFGPGNSQNQGEGGEQVFQMLWDCRFCGTKKLLGLDHRHCPNCGAAQDPEWRYFPSDEDKKEVTDPKYVYRGADKMCPYCSQPNSAASNFCTQCGGDLSTAKEAAIRESVDKGSEADAGKADDVTLKKWQAEQSRIAAEAKAGGFPGWAKALIIIGVIAAVIIGALIVLSNSTYDASLTVAGKSWERTIDIVEFRRVPGGGWCDSIPGDALVTNRTLRTDYRTERVQDGFRTERRDRGDGSFIEVQVPVYKDVRVPYDRWYCNYTVDRWVKIDTLRTTGDANAPPAWPNFTASGGSGIGARRSDNPIEVYRVIFKGNGPKQGQEYTFSTDQESIWQPFQVGRLYSVKFDRLENIKWDTLKLVD